MTDETIDFLRQKSDEAELEYLTSLHHLDGARAEAELASQGFTQARINYLTAVKLRLQRMGA